MKRTARFLTLFFLLSALLMGSAAPVLAAPAAQSATCPEVTLHYTRRAADYDGWGLHLWGPTPLAAQVAWDKPLSPAGQDDFGIFWTIPMDADAASLNYIIHNGDTKDPGPDQLLDFSLTGCEVWQIQGSQTTYTTRDAALAALNPQPVTTSAGAGENQVIIHYRRAKADYDGWGLHVWGPTPLEGIVTWGSPLLPAGTDDYGIYWTIEVNPDAEFVNYIVHKGDTKDPGPDQKLTFADKGREIWLIEGSAEQFSDAESAIQGLIIAGVGDITNKAQAHWLTREYLAWGVPYGAKATFTLHYDPQGAIAVTQTGLQGGQKITLEFAADNLPADLTAKYPHLTGSVLLKIPTTELAKVPEILKGQIAISVSAPDGSVLGATAVQIPGVLDDLYANDEPLGVVWNGNTPTLRVWAPTARAVTLLKFPDSAAKSMPEQLPMTLDPSTGIWSITGTPDWKNQYYQYQVEVFVRQEGKVVTNIVTDPYSLSLSQNSTRSQIVDLNDPALKPAGWDTLQKPVLQQFTDIVLYELHIRDFSARDQSVPEELRGTFAAFSQLQSDGMKHLQTLAAAGVTHIHLLPAFDIATINEDKSTWQPTDFAALSAMPADGEQQQEIVNATRGQDGFNWGYDPLHYTAPEGSYSTNPDGSQRILEFRQMVQSLNNAGLRVVMDVVYNHTNASGQSERAILDRIVPGYYHRLDANGNVATSTCCANTATEHAMMQKLMRDSLLTWATAYKVDGFRFDLMGHHMKANLLDVRAALDALTPAQNGVDGKMIYLYGEGWNFGEVANNARGENATQLNLGGTGIGTFNDRLRDAVRGGNPFRDPREQGFVTGLYTSPSDFTAAALPEKSQLVQLYELKEQIMVGLAGNLADYQLINAEGKTITGAQVNYNGAPAGYTQSPQENIVYVEAHDNETLFDAIQYKAAASDDLAARIRMQNLAHSIVAYSQGVPFFHAGTEMLRSKSMDRDSYDSGDWFNALDWTYTDNNWGHGLPLADKNKGNWQIIQPLLANAALKPSQSELQSGLNYFAETLQIRRSSPLFRLPDAASIQQKVKFLNTGAEQIPGLIALWLDDRVGSPVDANFEQILVLFNANAAPVTFTAPEVSGSTWVLHPLQQNSADAVTRESAFTAGAFRVPGRTAAVFVSERTTPLEINLPLVAGGETNVPAPAPQNNPSPLWNLWGWLIAIAAVLGAAAIIWARRTK